MEEMNLEERRELLLGRIKRCRCKFCGGELSLKRIAFSEFEDARLELYCESCGRLEFGVEGEIYDVGKYFVEDMEFNCFPNFPDNEHTKQMNIAKVCEILTFGNRQLGLLDSNGFIDDALKENSKKIGKCIVIEDSELGEM